MADLYQFDRTILQGIFRENLLGLSLPMEIRPPGFLWPRGWSQELNGWTVKLVLTGCLPTRVYTRGLCTCASSRAVVYGCPGGPLQRVHYS